MATPLVAPPVEIHPLLSALQSSLDPNTHRAALTQLQDWVTIPSYYPSLQDIFVNKEYDLGPHAREIRLQAVLQFKNGVDKYWRKGAENGIELETKRTMRRRLLTMVDEPDRVLAKNVALCIGKIARTDYGSDWQELPHRLIKSIKEGLAMPALAAHLRLHRSLIFLHATIKALSSNRMAKGRLLMVDICGKLFPALEAMYRVVLTREVDRLQALGRSAATGPGSAEGEMELALLGFKVLSKFVIYGFKDPSSDELAKSFFLSTLPSFRALFQLRMNLLPPPSDSLSSNDSFVFLTRHVVAYGKLYGNMIKHDSDLFVRMGATSEILEIYWSIVQGASKDLAANVSDSLSSPYPEKLVVQSLLLVQSGLGDWASSSPLAVTLPSDFIIQFAHLLVAKLLPLQQEDLEKWEDDPEEWMNEEEAERWEFELRPCAEHVLREVVNQYREEVGPTLCALLQRVSTPHDMESLLLKEAVYSAFGSNPSSLKEAINFDQWLDETLLVEAGGKDASYRIIRRRIAWLVGNWVGEDLSPQTRKKIYGLLLHLLGQNESTDTAIRLTAARSLAKCDTWDFDPESFVPFLPQSMEELVQLLDEVTLSDSQMRINQTLGVVIDRVGLHIQPYAGKLAEILALLWSAAQESHFQTSVLVTLTKLAEALGPHSQGLHSQAGPIILYSVDPSLPSHVYLQEDALLLWQVLLRRSGNLTPEMLALLPMLVTLLNAGTDVLPRVLRIFESYLLIDAPLVLQLCSGGVFVAFRDLLGALRLEAAKAILHALETLFQVAPIDLWAQSFDASCLLDKLVLPFQHEETAVLITKYLGTMSRLVLAGPSTFLPLATAAASRLGVPPTDLVSVIFRQWFDRLDNMGQPSQRKITALAMASLLPTAEPVILQEIPEMVSLFSSVLAETEEDESGDADLYRTADFDDEVEMDYTETLESSRRQALTARDPVHVVKLSAFISTKFAEVQAACGGQEVFQQKWLAKVDPLILHELSQRLDGLLAG